MTSVEYHLLDVFTAQPFAGNPLAVCVDQPVDDTATMQRVARELNLSETVFVRSPDDGSSRFPTRIFTPANELPFAGHPTIGTAVLLASLGLADGALVLAEGVGDVAVSVEGGDGARRAEFTTARLPERERDVERDRAAASLGIGAADLSDDLPLAVWSCGNPFAIVAVRDLDALARCGSASGYEPTTFAITPTGGALGATWRARSFVPGLGISEDPATGSAVAALAGYFAALPALDAVDRFVITQGVEMGRPSELHLTLDRDGRTLRAVRVAGDAVIVGRGTLTAVD